MLTPGYSPTATERVLPRLALDFTTGVLDPRVTVTRALNTATAINSSGFIAVVNANLPRFDYDPNTLAPRGLLIEESRSNLFIQSQFQGNWTANAGTTTFLGTYVTSPDGTSNGRILNDTSASAAAYVFQGVSFTNGTVYTLSVYVKKGVSRYFALTSFTQSGRALFDLNNYSLSSVTGIVTSATITAVGGGWYRCTATMAANATGTNNLGFGDFEASPTGDLYYLWGAQVEAGAFATSYIPTTTTSLTRNADVVTMTGTNFSSWYNAFEGAVFSEVTLSNLTKGQGPWAIGDNTLGFGSGRMMYVESSSGASGKLTFNVFNNGSQQVFMQPNVIPVVGTPIRSVFAYKVNSYAASVSAISPSTGSGALPSVNGMSIGSLVSAWSGATQYLNGHVRKMSYWPQRLINAEAQAFSK